MSEFCPGIFTSYLRARADGARGPANVRAAQSGAGVALLRPQLFNRRVVRLRRDRAPRPGVELDQVAREIHESFREVGRLQNFMGQIRKFKELIEHAESVSGEPITLFILHLDVDVGESKLHTCTVWYFAPNIIQRKYCNEKGLRGPESRPVLNLHHYILEPIKNRGSPTPMGEFGKLGSVTLGQSFFTCKR